MDKIKHKIESWVKINPETGCWNWRRCKTKQGYGKMWFRSGNWKAHRVSYTIVMDAFNKGRIKHYTPGIKNGHPSLSSYSRGGCRCEACKQIVSDYMKSRHKSNRKDSSYKC